MDGVSERTGAGPDKVRIERARARISRHRGGNGSYWEALYGGAGAASRVWLELVRRTPSSPFVHYTNIQLHYTFSRACAVWWLGLALGGINY